MTKEELLKIVQQHCGEICSEVDSDCTLIKDPRGEYAYVQSVNVCAGLSFEEYAELLLRRRDAGKNRKTVVAK